MILAAQLLLWTSLSAAPPYVRARVDKDDPTSECLYWNQGQVTWNLNELGNSQASGPHPEFDAIRRSFQSWQNVLADCGNFNLLEGPQVSDRVVGFNEERNAVNHNVVLFRDQRCADVAPLDDPCWAKKTCQNLYDCWAGFYGDRAIGVTTTSFDEVTGIIYDADIELNAASFLFTTVDSPACTSSTGPQSSCVAFDVENTVTHEVGHLMGLAHTSLAQSTMLDNAPMGETSKRTLDSGTSSFVCQVYPKGAASKNCSGSPLPSPATSSGGGCSAGGAALLGWSGLFASHLWPRRVGSRRKA